MCSEWIVIGNPYVENVDNGKVKLCAEIEEKDTKKVMYFEVDKSYEQYLCTELSDAFLTGIFYYAAYKGLNIKCLGKVSERLFYQLSQYFISTAYKMNSIHYKRIKIDAQTTTIKFDSNYAVGTSVSAGVDSFYSILSHYQRQDCKEYELTHLLLANLFNKYESEDSTRRKFKDLIEKTSPIAQKLGLPVIEMYTNHHEFLFPDFVEYYSFRIASYILALQKLFKVYLISSGTMFQDSNFQSDDSTDYDIFNTMVCTTDNISFYMSGGEKGRVEKIDYIQKNDIVKNHLHVCTMSDDKNCSECDKCMRTMAALDFGDELKNYSKIFDYNKYVARKNKYWGKVISKRKDNVYGTLNVELIKQAKLKHYKIPISSYMWAWFIWKPYFAIKSFLKKFKCVKKVYFALKLDYLVYGKEKAELYRFGKDEV